MIAIGKFSAMTSGQRAAVVPSIYLPAGAILPLAIRAGSDLPVIVRAVAAAGTVSVVEG